MSKRWENFSDSFICLSIQPMSKQFVYIQRTGMYLYLCDVSYPSPSKSSYSKLVVNVYKKRQVK